MAKAKRRAAKPQRGGAREGAGRPSWFRQSEGRKGTWVVRLTDRGEEIGEATIARLEARRRHDEPPISRNILIDALLRLHAKSFTIEDLRDVSSF
jgi:hypothetical protein